MREEDGAVTELKGEEWETSGAGGVRMAQRLEDDWEEALAQRAGWWQRGFGELE